MVSPLLKVCLSLYTLLRSHLSFSFVREFLYQEVLYLHAAYVVAAQATASIKNVEHYGEELDTHN